MVKDVNRELQINSWEKMCLYTADTVVGQLMCSCVTKTVPKCGEQLCVGSCTVLSSPRRYSDNP